MNPRPQRQRPGDRKLEAKVEPLEVGDRASEPAKSRSTKQRNSESPRARAGSADLPRYRQLVRVDSRLWPDQLTDLVALRREVSAARTDKSERITDNTLVRVAVDLLLAHRDQLRGDNEDELRKSVVPDSTARGR